MKRWLVIGGIVGVVALVAALALSAVAFAQGPQGRFAFGPGQFDGNRAGRTDVGGFPGGPAEFRGGPFGRGGFSGDPAIGPGGFGQIDRQALLAEALGITVEELEAAQEQANRNAVQQAVDQGLLTQDEADTILSRMALRSYLDRDALTAEALGITVAKLEQARADGKPLVVLIYELGLEPATVRTNMQAAHEAAIQQAVSDGVISQEQADDILDGAGRGFGGRGGFGRGGGRGFDHFGGFGRR